MKVLLTTIDKDANLQSQPAKTFGLAKSYILYDTCENKSIIIENTFYKNNHILIEDLKSLGVDMVVAEHICKSCYQNMKTENIDILRDDGSITVKEIIQKLLLGGLFKMGEPNMLMHKHIEYNKKIDYKEYLEKLNK